MTTKQQFVTSEIIQREFGRLGLTALNPSEYKNGATKLVAVDKEGYKVSITYEHALASKSYKKFQKSNPFTVHNIALWLELNDPDYELVSTEYCGSEEKLEWRMLSRPDLPTFFTSWHMFYSDGNRHPTLRFERGANSKRRNPQVVRRDIDKMLREKYPDWSMDENEEYKYKTAKHSKLKFTHKQGYKSLSTYSQIYNRTQKALPLFHPSYPETSIYNVGLHTHMYSQYELADGQSYTHFKGKYVFMCEDHGEFTNNFSTIYSYDTGCQECIYERSWGENNPNWNPELTDEIRESNIRQRTTPEYLSWRKEVLTRDNFMCIVCGEISMELLQVHHKDGFHWCHERRTDVTNGETLCRFCHLEYHQTFGFRHSTERQFEYFLFNKIVLGDSSSKTSFNKKNKSTEGIKDE